LQIPSAYICDWKTTPSTTWPARSRSSSGNFPIQYSRGSCGRAFFKSPVRTESSRSTLACQFPPRFPRDHGVDATGIEEHGSRIIWYKQLLEKLPRVQYSTLRKLFSHLKLITDYSQENMMPVQNLASIFGPTLFCVENVIDDPGGGGDEKTPSLSLSLSLSLL
jgi:RhoGAP domain